MVIYENVNYDLIITNKFHISLLISNHIGNTLCSYSFSLIFTLLHLKTNYGLKSSLCLHNHIRNESRKYNIIGITVKSVIQVE